jgi:hypothetical protein
MPGKNNKFSIVGLNGFFSNTPESREAIVITGDDETIVFTKGHAFEYWMTNETKIATKEGPTTVGEENVRRIQNMLLQWMRGEEVE